MSLFVVLNCVRLNFMRIKVYFLLLIYVSVLSCSNYNWLLVLRDLGGIMQVAWIWPTIQFLWNWVSFSSSFSLTFALTFEGFVSSLYLSPHFYILVIPHVCSFFSPSSLIELASDSETDLKTACLFTLYTLCSCQFTPPPISSLQMRIWLATSKHLPWAPLPWI